MQASEYYFVVVTHPDCPGCVAYHSKGLDSMIKSRLPQGTKYVEIQAVPKTGNKFNDPLPYPYENLPLPAARYYPMFFVSYEDPAITNKPLFLPQNINSISGIATWVQNYAPSVTQQETKVVSQPSQQTYHYFKDGYEIAQAKTYATPQYSPHYASQYAPAPSTAAEVFGQTQGWDQAYSQGRYPPGY